MFPTIVERCGVTKCILQEAFLQCLEGQENLCWILTKPVTVEFYRNLHRYLLQWPPSRSSTKATMGRFYSLVDVNFQSRRMSSRPDNIYMFVERVVGSGKLNHVPMYYGVDKTVEQLKHSVSSYQEDLEVMSQKVSKQQYALDKMKKQVEIASNELACSRHALSDVTNHLQRTMKQRDTARKQTSKIQEKLEAACLDSEYYEDEMQAENDKLTDFIKSLKSEMNSCSVVGSAVVSEGGDAMLCFEIKDGGHTYTSVAPC